ncbi:MAG: deoxyribodipyrimidine photolyase [Candidatus Marinimicrobia bacterium]|nr:deoxyribodipyrimidine photolyase [Candidatus Neomarinimicrobiota bacterium]
MPKSDTAPIVIWFRQDLRTADHPALTAAIETSAPIIPLYILDDATTDTWKLRGVSRWWLHGSLAALSTELCAKGSRLILRRGKTIDILIRFVAEVGAMGIYFSRGYTPHDTKNEEAIIRKLKTLGLDCRGFNGSLLTDPETLRTKTGNPFKVFTPFYKKCLASEGHIQHPLPVPKLILSPKIWPNSDDLSEWSLRREATNNFKNLNEHWQPGSEEATKRLETFLEKRVSTYMSDRDRPDMNGTSTLSPHLRFGEISARQIWQRTLRNSIQSDKGDIGRIAFLRELVWREFSYHLLFHWPHIPGSPFNASFKNFPWRTDAKQLDYWQRGLTGYPIVDAGMRQLWQTGWMHNRVRMIVASFLTKHLLIHWQEGALWFWDTLVDADLANNSASWQWVAGSGADAAPYFRIFNPILQGSKFDPNGDYVRALIPELSNFKGRNIHAPWESDSKNDYPPPIVDHRLARERALAAYKTIAKN